MHRFLLLLIGFVLIYSSGLPRHTHIHGTKKVASPDTKKPLSPSYTLDCPFIAPKYVEWAKYRVISLFNEPGYQESVTNLGLDAVTVDQVTLITDPRPCKSINDFMARWFDLEGDSDVSVFLKVSDYYLIVFVPDNATGPNSVTGFGSHPIYLLTGEFKPKTVWLY